MSTAPIEPKAFLQSLFQAAVNAAMPDRIIADHLPDIETLPSGRIIVIGAGKAAASMAKAVEDAWLDKLGNRLMGIVTTRYGHAVPTSRITVMESSHPQPDENSITAARQISILAQSATEEDFVLFLLSGGTSSLLCSPIGNMTLDDKQTVTDALLKSGASIQEMNTVRKHLSLIKGGQLMQHIYPAQCLTLAISDVVGDDLDVIGSGPTVPDSSTWPETMAIIEKYNITLPQSVQQFLAEKNETPKHDNPIFSMSQATVIASSIQSLQAAEHDAIHAHMSTIILSDSITGEARTVAKDMAAEIVQQKSSLTKSTVFLSGGETTVTVTGDGRGGRNAEFLLSLAIALNGEDGIYAIACDTDGIDGIEDNAGAIITPDTLTRAKELGMDAQSYLDNNDAYTFFEKLGDLVFTGPTLTNVNDFRAVLTIPSS